MSIRGRVVDGGARSLARIVDAVDRRRTILGARQHQLHHIAAGQDLAGSRVAALEESLAQLRFEIAARDPAAQLNRLEAGHGIQAELADARAREDADRSAVLRELLEAQRALLDAQRERIDAIERRLEDAQGLVARVRDDLADNRAAVARARAERDYDEAWGERPLISIRIPTFQNAEQLVSRTLPTVQAQTYEHWECVVVGDAVTDDTAERIAALGDPRIRFENLDVRGPYPELPRRRWLVAGTQPANRAADLARGHWIAPLDHDDELDPDHLEVLLDAARESRAEFVYGQMLVRDANTGAATGAIVGRYPPQYGHIGLQSGMYHAGLHRAGIALDPHAWLGDEPGDWNLVRRFWDAGVRFSFIDRPVVTYYYAGSDGRPEA